VEEVRGIQPVYESKGTQRLPSRRNTAHSQLRHLEERSNARTIEVSNAAWLGWPWAEMSWGVMDSAFPFQLVSGEESPGNFELC
jgi:hypothetical protein